MRNIFLPLAAAAGTLLCAVTIAAMQSGHKEPIGYSDTPMLPDQPWRVHDIKRPHPKEMTPGDKPGAPPSDAIVLFDGKDLSKLEQHGKGPNRGKTTPPQWKVGNGYFEVASGTG